MVLWLLLSTCKTDYRDCKTCSCKDVKQPTGTATIDSLKIYVPTVFTPNGDGWNDRFRPWFRDDYVQSMDFTVKSRNEKRTLFHSTDLASSYWDGKDDEGRAVGDRIFYWKLSGTTTWGKSFSLEGEILVETGDCYKKGDYSKCRFGDQNDPNYGFVYPTQEKKCD